MSKLGPQETLVVEGDVLNADHDLGSDKDEEHLHQSAEPIGLTQLYKVEAVGGNRQGNVVHQPEHQILCNGGKMHGCKCTDGDEAPQAEVGEEQVVGDEHQRIGGDHHDKGQNDGLPELAAADLHAALCQVQAVLLAIAVIGHHHPGQCDGQSGYGVTTLDAVVESIVCMKFEEILECSKSNLLEEMRRKDLDAAKKEATRWKEEVQTKVDEQDALKKEMIRVIQGTSGLDREMIQQMVNENKEALLTAQTNLADSEKKLKEIEEQNQKAERNCSDLFTWASTYKGASFERRQAILKQFIKEVRVGRDYNIEIVLNVPLDEFEEFKRHAASAGRGKNQKNKSQNPQKVGRCTSNAGIVVLDKTAGETISIVPKNAAHAILRC